MQVTSSLFTRLSFLASQRSGDVPVALHSLPECLNNPDIQSVIETELGIRSEHLPMLYDDEICRRAANEGASVSAASARQPLEALGSLAKDSLTRATEDLRLAAVLVGSGFAIEMQRAVAELEQLAISTDCIDAGKLVDVLVESVCTDIFSLAADAFGCECNFAVTEGLLQPDSPTETVHQFSLLLANSEYLDYFLGKYPVLVARSRARIDLIRLSIERLIKRFAADRSHINERLGARGGSLRIANISRGSGDSHQGADSVSILRLESGELLVYKPRSVDPEASFQVFLEWLARQDENFRQKSPWVISKEHYGWMEHISAEDVQETDIQKYYYRYGVLVGAVFALNGTDIHHENLISQGSFPVIVDLETIFQPTMIAGVREASPSYLMDLEFYVNSPLYTAMIDPAFLEDTLRGGPLALSCEKVKGDWVLVRDESNGALRFERMPVAAHGNNLLRCRGEIVDFTRHVSEILDGFRDVYACLVQNKLELLSTVLDAVGQGMRVRVIFKPTGKYAKVLGVLNSAYAQESAFQHDEYVGKMWLPALTKSALSSVVMSEVRDLWNGDIPYFSADAGSVDVVDCAGKAIGGVLFRSGLTVTKSKVASLSWQTLEADVAAVRYSLLRKHSETTALTPNGSIHKGALSGGADAVLGLISERMKVVDGRVVFADLILGRDMQTRVRPLGSDLYSGLPGVVLALAYGGGDASSEHDLGARKLAAAHFADLDLIGSEKIGMCEGLGGSLYLAAHLGSLWNEHAYGVIADVIVDRIVDLAYHDRHLDIFSGAAGAILALVSARDMLPHERIASAVKKLVSHLDAHAIWNGGACSWVSSIPSVEATSGFAHGVSGIAYALLRAHEFCGGVDSLRLIEGAHLYLEKCRVEGSNGWQEEPSRPSSQPMDVWCHGAAGIGRFYFEAGKVLGEPYRTRSDAALDLMAKSYEFDNDSLCHGVLGNIDVFIDIAVRHPEHAWYEEAKAIVESVASSISSRELKCGNKYHHHSVSLFNGFSGMALQMKRAASPIHLPSVLAFEGPLVHGH